MPGVIILKMDGEIISQKRYNCPKKIEIIRELWKKLYAKGLDKCEVIIEKDPKTVKSKS